MKEKLVLRPTSLFFYLLIFYFCIKFRIVRNIFRKNINWAIIIKSHYVWFFCFFLVWLLFFDEHNIIRRIDNYGKYKQLEEDVFYYKGKIKEDREKLNELTSNKENLERFAREQYLMKKENEDVFVVIEKD
ncbi:septum formation inhibitor [Puteibacter caeruleilacunae]|nr:septum formation inhibitor [Puteibacter caeruleilacunae]